MSAIDALVARHFDVEPDLEEVYVIIDRPRSAKPHVRMLQINSATVPTGRLESFTFSPTGKVPFVTSIAEITPDELEEFRRDESRLPSGWSLTAATKYPRRDGTNG